MLNEIKNNQEVDDQDFDLLFPEDMREAASFHFTPVEIAKVAAKFLVEKEGVKVLDIGAGAGKFCLIAAALTSGYFTGIEQRKDLVKIAQKLASQFGLTNTKFLHGNIANLNFSDYHAFYIFNPFMEHRSPEESFDANLNTNKELYFIYSDFVKNQLKQMPIGTRLVTYFSYGDEVPGNYVRVGGDEAAKLRFWICT